MRRAATAKHSLKRPVRVLAGTLSVPALVCCFTPSWSLHDRGHVLAGRTPARPRARAGRTSLLARPLGLPGALCDLGVARRRSALQANADRSRMGPYPPISYDGCFHYRLRPPRSVAERRGGAVPDHGVRRDAAVVSVFDDPD